MKLLAKTLQGLEGPLQRELEALGAQNIEKLKRAVAFEGGLALLYRAALHLRTAISILKPFHEFKAWNEDQLYKRVGQVNWAEHISLDQTFAIDSTVYSTQFRHSQYVAFKVKDAIVDQFRKKTGRRPSVDIKQPDVRISVHVSERLFTLSIDCTGERLYRRGYRQPGHRAPLNEVLAAGMIALSGWTGDRPFYDPMCGSGTLPIEAALLATRTAPGLLRKHFAFMNWPDFDPEEWKKALKEAQSLVQPAPAPIYGNDISGQAIDLARAGAIKAGLDQAIHFTKGPFSNLQPREEEGLIMMNPPYGERLGEKDMIPFYQEIGDNLKQNWPGFEAWVLSGNLPALKRLGLRPSKKLTLFNGPLECRFQGYELFSGKRKDHLAASQ